MLTCLLLCELSMLGKMIPEVSTLHDVDDKVEILSVLECVVHVYKESI